jgi:hypothetical protein
VTLLFAKYVREVAKALPSDQAYPLRGSEERTARASNGSGLIPGFGTFRTSPLRRMSASRQNQPFETEVYRSTSLDRPPAVLV